jgi:hypothetical protein
VIPSISDYTYQSWLSACGGNAALLSERLGLFKTVQRSFASAEDVLPALRELARSGLAVSAATKTELVEYLLDEHTHLFEHAPSSSSLDAHANAGAADGLKAKIVHSASPSDWTQLFVVGEGFSNLLWRLEYLDAVGRRFISVAEMRAALASLRGTKQPTDEEREVVLTFLASGECTLLQHPEPETTGSENGLSADEAAKQAAADEADMEIDAAHLDAAILCSGGVDGCLRGLRALQRDQVRVRGMHELVAKLFAMHPSSHPAPAAPLGAQQQQPIAAIGDSTGNASGGAVAATAVAAGSPSVVAAPLDNSAMHDLLLEYLGEESVILLAPLADVELEVSEEELDAMVAATAGDVHTTLAVLRRLNEQQRGFTSLSQLAQAVQEEYQIIKNQALAGI